MEERSKIHVGLGVPQGQHHRGSELGYSPTCLIGGLATATNYEATSAAMP
jgi:hypothetical protein